MKQRRPHLYLLLIGFFGLVLRFPSAQMVAEETSVPSVTPAATDAAGISPTPSLTPEPPAVRWVGVHNRVREQRDANVTYAQRGDDIWVDIINFNAWVESLGDKKPPNHEVKDLILYLNHIPLHGVSPIYSHGPYLYYTETSVAYTVTTVGFPKHALDNNEQQQNEVRERLANYRWQSAYFAWPTWKGVTYDLLAENNLISFHRFQIFIWTLILGIMFIANVYNELAMPQFSATLLGLLGISAGTYVGFKLPETKAQ